MVAAAQAPPQRLLMRDGELLDHRHEPFVLTGVNIFLEWFIHYHKKAVLDIESIRREMPHANMIRCCECRVLRIRNMSPMLLFTGSLPRLEGTICSRQRALRWFQALWASNNSIHLPKHSLVLALFGPRRLVGLFFDDSPHEHEGLECSTPDQSQGYISEHCWQYLDELIEQAC